MRDKAKNQNRMPLRPHPAFEVGGRVRRPVRPPDVLPMPPGIYLTETARQGRFRGRVLLLVGGIVFVDTMFFAALTPLLPDYADEFNLSKAARRVVGGVSGRGTGRRHPRRSRHCAARRRPTAITGLLLIAVTTFVFANADSIWLLDSLGFVQGLGSAAAWTAGLTWLVGETPSDRRGQTIGTAMAAAIVGALFGPVLGGARGRRRRGRRFRNRRARRRGARRFGHS